MRPALRCPCEKKGRSHTRHKERPGTPSPLSAGYHAIVRMKAPSLCWFDPDADTWASIVGICSLGPSFISLFVPPAH